jgi:5'-nucleotidase
VARDLVERFMRAPFRQPVLLNVNVPDLPYEQIKGVRVTRLGKRHKAEPVIRSLTPRNEIVYWVGPAGGASDAGEGTDFHAVAQGYVSVTPLRIDLTHVGQIDSVAEWMQQ